MQAGLCKQVKLQCRCQQQPTWCDLLGGGALYTQALPVPAVELLALPAADAHRVAHGVLVAHDETAACAVVCYLLGSCVSEQGVWERWALTDMNIHSMLQYQSAMEQSAGIKLMSVGTSA